MPLRTSRGLICAGLAVAAAASLLGLWLRGAPGSRPAAALPDEGLVPAFTLTDQRGRTLTRGDLDGRVWIADFIFTRCAGQCPLMSARMASLQSAFAGAPDLALVSFTVDPEHDTPPVLAAYAARFAADPGRWRFATGPRAAVEALARDGFRLAFGAGGSADEPIVHSVRLVLVDRAGHIRGSYDATDAEAVRRLALEAGRLLAAGRAHGA